MAPRSVDMESSSSSRSSSSSKGLLLTLLATTLFTTSASAVICNRFESDGVIFDNVLSTRWAWGFSRTERCSVNETGQSLPSGAPCNTTSCPLSTVPNLYISSRAELNYTTTNATYDQEILALVKRSVPSLANDPRYNFNLSVALAPKQTYEECINEDTTQQWRYTPRLICVNGTLSECAGGVEDAPPNGTVISACGNVVEGYKNSRVAYGAGTTSLVYTMSMAEVPAPGNLTLSGAGELPGGSWGLPVAVVVALWELL